MHGIKSEERLTSMRSGRPACGALVKDGIRCPLLAESGSPGMSDSDPLRTPVDKRKPRRNGIYAKAASLIWPRACAALKARFFTAH